MSAGRMWGAFIPAPCGPHWTAPPPCPLLGEAAQWGFQPPRITGKQRRPQRAQDKHEHQGTPNPAFTIPMAPQDVCGEWGTLHTPSVLCCVLVPVTTVPT